MTAPSPNTAGLEVVATVVSAHGDPESFGERTIDVVANLSRIPYNTDLVTASSAQAAIDEERATKEAARERIDIEMARAQAAEARVAELEAAKWETRHADTMNDLVAMGLARDAAEARADRLADGITAAMLILTPEPGDKSLTEREKTARQLLAALQDQPK